MFKHLLWIEWRTVQPEIEYWFKILGIDSEETRIYRLYVALFYVVWVFAIWGYAIEQAYQGSRALSPTVEANIISRLPLLLGVVQLVYIVWCVRDVPLKFTTQDTTFLASSPISRSQWVVVRLLRNLLLPAMAISLIGTLLNMTLSWSAAGEQIGISGLLAFIVTFLLVYITGFAAWAIGLLRYRRGMVLGRWVGWLVVVALAIGVYFLPQVFLITGDVWVATLGANLMLLDGVLLAVLLLTSLGALWWVSTGLQTAAIIEQSAMYARIAKFGMLGRIYARDVIARIKQQARLARRQGNRLKLIKTSSRPLTLWGRAMVSLGQPLTLVTLIGQGAFYSFMLHAVLLVSGTQNLLVWAAILLFVVQSPPRNILDQFRQDLQSPFLRQFNRANSLTSLLATTITPIVLMSFGASLIAFIQPAYFPLWGVLLSVNIVVLVAFVQALEVVHIEGIGTVPYAYVALGVGLCLVAAVYITVDILAVVMITLALNYALSQMIASGKL